MSPHPTHVVIAGGGVAAVELALALDDLAGASVRMTLVAPGEDFGVRALRPAQPFAAAKVRRYPLEDVADRVGATLVADTVIAVEPQRHEVRLGSGRRLAYDALVLATGGRHREVYGRALTFTGDRSTLSYNGLLADLEEHWTRSVAFVVPPGTTWPVPLYELALMTAQAVRGMGIDDTELELITPEWAPLCIFGAAASAQVARLLDEAGVTFRGGVEAGSDGAGRPTVGGVPLAAQRIVALPTIEGPLVDGLPLDAAGFLPTDELGHVAGVEDVYAAGDVTAQPVKQGGLACQQADTVASALAAAAGAGVTPKPFRPVVHQWLLTSAGPVELGPEGTGGVWSEAHKVEGRHLSRWLEERDAVGAC